MTRPNTALECPVCKRVEMAIKTDSVLNKLLSKEELLSLVSKVQSAILNKTDIERGVSMTENDEKYVITKATFQEFYETQDLLVSIIAKMADRIEKQDQVLMKYGAALSELIAKGIEDEAMMGMMGQEAEPSEESEPSFPGVQSEPSMGEDLLESEVSAPGEPSLEGIEESLSEAENAIEESKEAIAGVEGGAGMMASKPTEMQPMAMADVKSAFEAGYKAALAEVKKQTGVPVQPADFKGAPARGVSAIDQSQQSGQNGSPVLQKSLMDEDLTALGSMSASEVIKRLKEEGRF